jgi:hypothetical protein
MAVTGYMQSIIVNRFYGLLNNNSWPFIIYRHIRSFGKGGVSNQIERISKRVKKK